jgi:rod shape-determining protein MreD
MKPALASVDGRELFRRLTPALSVVAAIFLVALPLPLAWGVLPHLPLLLVIIWASLQPRLLPASSAFLLGLCFDLVAGLPLGLSALLFAGAAVAVRLAEDGVEGHSLGVDWTFAAVLVLVGQLLTTQLLALVELEAPIGPLLVQALTTILAYPPVALVAAAIQRRLVAGDG